MKKFDSIFGAVAFYLNELDAPTTSEVWLDDHNLYIHATTDIGENAAEIAYHIEQMIKDLKGSIEVKTDKKGRRAILNLA